MRIALICHPDTPSNNVSGVTAQLDPRPGGDFWIEYTVASAESLALPTAKAPERADDLWNSTCFELFARTRGSDAYVELNFSPSFQWAAYAFTGYRSGRRNFETLDPEIVTSPAGNWFFLSVEALPDLGPEPLQLGLSAIIEETDGTKSYWALAHPPGDKPDFHDPTCFALELPAATTR
ncbi:MAG TPA: DOMON-like domain-containing protein [Allosphingosinicella sp.]